MSETAVEVEKPLIVVALAGGLFVPSSRDRRRVIPSLAIPILCQYNALSIPIVLAHREANSGDMLKEFVTSYPVLAPLVRPIASFDQLAGRKIDLLVENPDSPSGLKAACHLDPREPRWHCGPITALFMIMDHAPRLGVRLALQPRAISTPTASINRQKGGSVNEPARQPE